MAALALEKIAILTEKVTQLSGASLNVAPAQAAQAGEVATIAKSPGATAAAGRRLKAAFRVTLLKTPLKTFRGIYGRHLKGVSYSHHDEDKIISYVRELQAREPTLLGGSSVDSIIANDSADEKIVTVWNRWYQNTRAKLNEMVVLQWKNQDMCSRSLGIRESETPASAMGERLIELASMVSGLGRNMELTPLHLSCSRVRG